MEVSGQPHAPIRNLNNRDYNNWISNLFRMMVESSFLSKASKSMYACDSGTRSRTFWGKILSANFFFFLLVEWENSLKIKDTQNTDIIMVFVIVLHEIQCWFTLEE